MIRRHSQILLALASIVLAQSAHAIPILTLEAVDVRHLPQLTVQFEARDSSGEEVPGLRSDDFRLILDGEPVEGLTISASSQQEDRTVIFVLESSSYVRGRDFFLVRNLVAEITDRLAPSARVGLVAAGGPVLGQVEPTADRAQFKRGLAELSPSGESVPLNAAILQALGRLRDSKDAGRAIVLLASGQGISDDHLRADAIATARQLKTAIHVIAAGLRFESPSLPSYSSLSGGRYYPEPISANAADLVRRALASGTGRYTAAVKLAAGNDGRPHHASLELFALGQSVTQEFSFLMTPDLGISPDEMNEYQRRSGARQSWWMVYFGAIIAALGFVVLRDRLGLRSPSARFLMLAVGLATGALLGFVLSRLSAT